MITQYFPPKYTFREECPTLSTESSRKVRHLTGASSELLSVLVLNLPHYPSVPFISARGTDIAAPEVVVIYLCSAV